MPTHTITTYYFDDLSDKAKERARDWWKGEGLSYEWWDSIYEDAKNIGKLMGVEIKDIMFSGFSSQGDGACFVGEYEYKEGGVQAVKEYAPLDERLHTIAKELDDFKLLRANFVHRHPYCHEYASDITVYEVSETDPYDWWEEAGTTQSVDLVEVLRSFMRWTYRQLEKEYEYLMSDEHVDEDIRSNGYEFTKEGKVWTS